MDLLRSTSWQARSVDRARAALPTGETAAPSPDDTGRSAPTTADAPATTAHVSRGGFFLRMLQHFEDRHPEETKEWLSGVADKLRADAEDASPRRAERLNAWADRFERAAETGDLSSLLPSRPSSHFGIRAYQRSQADAPGQVGDFGEIEGSLTITTTTTTTTTTTITRSGAAEVTAPTAVPSQPSASAPGAPDATRPDIAAAPREPSASDAVAPDATQTDLSATSNEGDAVAPDAAQAEAAAPANTAAKPNSSDALAANSPPIIPPTLI